jgi:pimeloyl-ACP methyl ester carboxylesterase
MPVLRTAVLEIAYADHGDEAAPALVVVHGWPDAARGWTPVVDALVAAGLRVLVPDLRGAGDTRFTHSETVRDGTAVALAQDVVDLADGLGLDRFAVVGHDWGGRAAYTLAALWPERLASIAALALGYQPRGRFVLPDFAQCQRFWYQWLMYVDAGADALIGDPIGFARRQWETWSPAGWFDEAEFGATASVFRHPDWSAITLNAYRSRFDAAEPVDPRYDDLRVRLDAIDHLTVPTLMIQGGADFCDPPSESAGLEHHFDTYRRIVLDGVGHFPHREAPDTVGRMLLDQFGRS